jgi:sec-independent protein translocase protein TatC
MTETSIEATVQRLADSSGGQILASTAEGLQRSLKWYLSLFVVGFVASFPMTREVIAWLIDADRLPSGVDIIVVSPVEFLFLQLRMAGSVGLLLVALLMVGQVTLHGVRHQAVQARMRELDLVLPRPGPTLTLSLSVSLLLMVTGLLYAWHGLIPMLLDYLTTDAQQAGLSTEWRLSGYAGFVVNLLAASAIGFQAPLVTTLVLRSGAVTHQQLRSWRRGIWFGAFVMGAMMSPPDPLSLFLVALPVVFLFELAMFIEGLRQPSNG